MEFRRSALAWSFAAMLLLVVLAAMPVESAPTNAKPWLVQANAVTLTRTQLETNNPDLVKFLGFQKKLFMNFTYLTSGAAERVQGGQFYFTTNGNDPTPTNSAECSGQVNGCALTAGQNTGAGATNNWTLTAAAGIPVSFFQALPDGQLVKFQVEIRTQTLPGTTVTTFNDNNAANGFFKYKMDTKLANGTMTSIAGLYNKKSDRIELLTNTRTPLLVFNVSDPSTGSGIDLAKTKLRHSGGDNTTQYETSAVASHSVVFTYSYAAGKGHPFNANKITPIDALFLDKAGNVNNLATHATFKGWNLTVDTLAPSISNDRVTTPGNKTTVAPGAAFEVQANVTDNLVGVQRIHAVLFNVSRGLWSDEFVLEPVTGQAKTFRNTTVAVPSTWPDTPVSVQVNATDKVGNRATKLVTTLALDTKAPSITVTPVAQYVRTGPYLVRATVLDNGTGIDPATVTLLFKVGSAAEQSRTMVLLNPPGGGEYSAEIPDQPDGSVLSYRVRARDKSGGETTSLARGFVVDKAGPTIGLSPETDFVGQGPYQLGAVIADVGAGVDDDPAPSLKWRAGTTGSYATEQMERGAKNLWTAQVPDQSEGSTIHYYIEAQDVLGNRATKGTSAAPLTLTVDKTPPTFNLTVPRTVTEPKFKISWEGEDAVSGVATYTVEFRESTRDDWIGLPDLTNTTATSYDFCAAGGKSYEFRGWATDRAGNSGTIPPQPTNTVQVDSDENCVAPPNVALQYPNGDEELSGDVVVLWTAASPQFGPELDVTLQVSEDKELWSDIDGARGLANSGSHTWATAETVADGEYWLRVRAVDPNGLVGVDESDATFTVDNGIAVIGDTDNDGLPDDWERRYFGSLAENANGDADGDGYLNAQELADGTNPASAASNAGGVGQQWSEAYWLVLALFAAILVVTVLGFATRW